LQWRRAFYNFSKLLAYAIAIPAFWAYIDTPDRRRLFLMAVAGVVAFLLRHDHGVYVGLTAILTVALVWHADLRRVAREVALLGVMALTLVVPYLLYVQLHYGLVLYFDSFVRYARQTAERTSGEELRMSFDSKQPLVLHLASPRLQPHIHVRWREGAAAQQRADREQALGLAEPLPIMAMCGLRGVRPFAASPSGDRAGSARRRYRRHRPPNVSCSTIPTTHTSPQGGSGWSRQFGISGAAGVLHRGNAVAFPVLPDVRPCR
jgi:hypothetical protein